MRSLPCLHKIDGETGFIMTMIGSAVVLIITFPLKMFGILSDPMMLGIFGGFIGIGLLVSMLLETSILGPNWVYNRREYPYIEYTGKRVCKKCGLIQKEVEGMDGEFGGEIAIWVDVGYAENKEELASAWCKINAERNHKASLKNQEKERSIRENIISTSELLKQEPE